MNSDLVSTQCVNLRAGVKTHSLQSEVQETESETGFLQLTLKGPLIAYDWPRRQVTIVLRVTSNPQ